MKRMAKRDASVAKFVENGEALGENRKEGEKVLERAGRGEGAGGAAPQAFRPCHDRGISEMSRMSRRKP